MLTRPLLLSRLDAVKMFGSANEERVVADGVGGQSFLIQEIFRKFEKILAGLEDHAFAFLALEINLSVGEHGGGGVIATDAFLPMDVTGAGIDEL